MNESSGRASLDDKQQRAKPASPTKLSTDVASNDMLIQPALSTAPAAVSFSALSAEILRDLGDLRFCFPPVQPKS